MRPEAALSCTFSSARARASSSTSSRSTSFPIRVDIPMMRPNETWTQRSAHGLPIAFSTRNTWAKWSD
jgi:hypothetical protein